MKLDIGNTVASGNSAIPAHAIPSESMDNPSTQGLTRWNNEEAPKQWGIFLAAGDFKSAILMKAIWNVGKGWTTLSTHSQQILDRIVGNGKQNFDDILFNMEVMKRVFGDAYAEIIRDPKTNELVNLKILDPANVTILSNNKAMIKGYELATGKNSKGKTQTFKAEQIFHMPNNMLGNQIHGISDIAGMEKTILADDKSFEDLQNIVSFQAKPFIIFKMKTDDQTLINAFVTKVRNARAAGDDMFIPDDENLLSYEVVQVNPSSILMEWRNDLRNGFYRKLGLPLILFGASGSTESGGKMETFAHEQVFEYDQRDIEGHVWDQLGHKIDLISPTSLLNSLQSDQAKDASQGLEVQPSDVTAGSGR